VCREAAEFIVAARPLSIDDKAGKNVQTDAAKDVLRAFAALLDGYAGEWSAAALEPVVVRFTEERGLKLGQVRAARAGCAPRGQGAGARGACRTGPGGVKTAVQIVPALCRE
jgi:hypothetical protein